MVSGKIALKTVKYRQKCRHSYYNTTRRIIIISKNARNINKHSHYDPYSYFESPSLIVYMMHTPPSILAIKVLVRNFFTIFKKKRGIHPDKIISNILTLL